MQLVSILLKYTKYFVAFCVISFCSYFIFNTSFVYDGIRYFTLFDDTMISMRYAKNFVHGLGLVYNIGEYVEGFTNFLWMFFYSVVELTGVGDSKTSLVISTVSLLILLTNLVLSYKISLTIINDSKAATKNEKQIIQIGILLFIGLFYAIIFWSLLGLEVGVIVFLMNCTIYKSIKPFKSQTIQISFLSIIVSILFLIRMDTVIYTAVILMVFAFKYFKRVSFIKLIIPFLTLSFTIISLTIFRLYYFGDYLPNTFFLKVSVPLTERLYYGGKFIFYSFLESWALYFLLFIILLFINRILFKKYYFFFLIYIISIAYSIYVGGDSWENNFFPNRHITAGIAVSAPLFFSLLIISLRDNIKYKQICILFAVMLGVCMLYFLFFYKSGSSRMYFGRFGNMGLALIVFLFICAVGLYKLSTNYTESREYSVISILFLVIWLHMNAYSFLGFKWYKCKDVQDSKSLALFALDLKKYSDPSIKIGVTFAGVTPYFSGRYSVDLLGKCERKIAKMPRRKEAHFKSGHMKWDLIYSIQQYHPDMILHTWVNSEEELKYLIDKYDNYYGVWIRKGYINKVNPILIENLKNRKYFNINYQ